jgi:hypothetical protein
MDMGFFAIVFLFFQWRLGVLPMLDLLLIEKNVLLKNRQLFYPTSDISC